MYIKDKISVQIKYKVQKLSPIQKHCKMFKLFFLLLIASLSLFPHLSDAECCGRTIRLYFTPREDKNCQYFGGWNIGSKRCAINVCGDGELLKSGAYCGVGRCNIFGCNCDGGCRRGYGVEYFQDIHGDKVYNVIRKY